jgi:hypothetical protein
MRKLVFGVLFTQMLILHSYKAKPAGINPAGDTVIIRLKNKNQVMVITEKSRNLDSFKNINLNKLISDIDSVFKAGEKDLNGTGLDMEIFKKDSTLRIRMMKDRKGGGTTIYKAIVRIQDSEAGAAGNDTIYKEAGRKRVHFFKISDDDEFDDTFQIDLGWNNFLSSNGSLPSDQNKDYGIGPAWSNVVSLRLQKFLNLKKKSDLFTLSTGIEVSWNNYKFDNDVIIKKGPNTVQFEPFPADQKKIKSKLAICWLNIPLMFHYNAPKSSFHLAAGGFAGYRLTSWSKTKYESEGNEKKDHETSNFYLNGLQYGARIQVGFFDVDVFAQYNFNSLFSANRGPALTPFSFGFTF